MVSNRKEAQVAAIARLLFKNTPAEDRLANMFRTAALLALLALAVPAFSQGPNGDFKLALPTHHGQLKWTAAGFSVVESSAKPAGTEIGVRANNSSAKLSFLGFLFQVTGETSLSSAKCRDGALASDQKSISALKNLDSPEPGVGGIPVALSSYKMLERGGKTYYYVRGFVAAGDLCGDLEFYSETPISASDPILRNAFSNFQLDQDYVPQFNDAFVYAQILYKAHQYGPAGMMFDLALKKLDDNTGTNAKTIRRIVTDQAGMSHGMAGDISGARAIFTRALAKDPDYPLYYYNLACADAEEKKLADAQRNLQKAFDLKANVIPGETMPDPTEDDSFRPYKNNKDFWKFLESLH